MTTATELSHQTDLYIATGTVGRANLSAAWFTWPEVLTMAARELWRCGEAAQARATLKARRVTVRRFLLERFGIVTGAHEFFHDSALTPDRADLRDFLRACRWARRVNKDPHQ